MSTNSSAVNIGAAGSVFAVGTPVGRRGGFFGGVMAHPWPQVAGMGTPDADISPPDSR
jgi:hypothetical protein